MLKAACAAKGLPATGAENQLVRRLENYFNNPDKPIGVQAEAERVLDRERQKPGNQQQQQLQQQKPAPTPATTGTDSPICP